eukprot:Platyproteum_vivax@DN3442_c0_g1_i1.p1
MEQCLAVVSKVKPSAEACTLIMHALAVVFPLVWKHPLILFKMHNNLFHSNKWASAEIFPPTVKIIRMALDLIQNLSPLLVQSTPTMTPAEEEQIKKQNSRKKKLSFCGRQPKEETAIELDNRHLVCNHESMLVLWKLACVVVEIVVVDETITKTKAESLLLPTGFNSWLENRSHHPSGKNGSKDMENGKRDNRDKNGKRRKNSEKNGKKESDSDKNGAPDSNIWDYWSGFVLNAGIELFCSSRDVAIKTKVYCILTRIFLPALIRGGPSKPHSFGDIFGCSKYVEMALLCLNGDMRKSDEVLRCLQPLPQRIQVYLDVLDPLNLSAHLIVVVLAAWSFYFKARSGSGVDGQIVQLGTKLVSFGDFATLPNVKILTTSTVLNTFITGIPDFVWYSPFVDSLPHHLLASWEPTVSKSHRQFALSPKNSLLKLVVSDSECVSRNSGRLVLQYFFSLENVSGIGLANVKISASLHHSVNCRCMLDSNPYEFVTKSHFGVSYLNNHEGLEDKILVAVRVVCPLFLRFRVHYEEMEQEDSLSMAEDLMSVTSEQGQVHAFSCLPLDLRPIRYFYQPYRGWPRTGQSIKQRLDPQHAHLLMPGANKLKMEVTMEVFRLAIHRCFQQLYLNVFVAVQSHRASVCMLVICSETEYKAEVEMLTCQSISPLEVIHLVNVLKFRNRKLAVTDSTVPTVAAIYSESLEEQEELEEESDDENEKEKEVFEEE